MSVRTLAVNADAGLMRGTAETSLSTPFLEIGTARFYGRTPVTESLDGTAGACGTIYRCNADIGPFQDLDGL